MTTDINELRRRMDGAMKSLHSEFGGLRTGRANSSLLDNIQVEVYGAMTPLNQVGNISIPEPHLLCVQVWDKTAVKAVEKAINAAGLGVNASADGQTVRVPIPPLSQERRVELTKIAAKYSEAAKVSVRNIRRDGNDALKKAEKDGDISKDDLKKQEETVQKLTDEFIKKIDDALAVKNKEILGN
ncbi:MAG: ribosome recycling factor [Alphaproteobacteria bacterium]|nr:ribosome recycling factor [Alphaproteobacteria bacterium]